MPTLTLPHFTSKCSVPVAAIEYLPARGNDTIGHLMGQKSMLIAITLKRLAERLPTFLRIHKGNLVNAVHIISYRLRSVNAPFVELSQDRYLLLSRRQTTRLKPQLSRVFSLMRSTLRG